MKLKHIATLGLALAPISAIAAPNINGAGATFPAPIYQRWFADYAAQTGNKVNYQSVGSGAGVRQYIANTVEFGASDEFIRPKEIAKVKRGVVQIPLVGGTIALPITNPDVI
jgi:phosphate transport system substrate-binding protein